MTTMVSAINVYSTLHQVSTTCICIYTFFK